MRPTYAPGLQYEGTNHISANHVYPTILQARSLHGGPCLSCAAKALASGPCWQLD